MSRARVWAFAWVCLFFFAQNGLYFFYPCDVAPLLVGAVVFYALSEGPFFGFILGIFAGALLELFGVGKIGLEPLFFAGAGFLSGMASSRIFHESFIARTVLPVLVTYGLCLFNLSLSRATSGEAPWNPALFRDAFLFYDLASTALLSPFVFYILSKFSFSGRKKRRPAAV